MSQILDLPKPAAAEDLAAALSHWQVLDVVYVHANERMQISAGATPWRPLQQLIALGILKRSEVTGTYFSYLIPGQRFRPVLESLWRSGRVKRPVEVEA